MSIDNSTRQRLYEEQRLLTGQSEFCSISLTFFEFNRSKNPRPFLKRSIVSGLNAQIDEAARYTSGTLLEGHTYGNGKKTAILLYSVLHTQITAIQKTWGLHNADGNGKDLEITRMHARQHLISKWKKVALKELPEYAQYNHFGAAWMNILFNANLLPPEEETPGLLFQQQDLPQSDCIKLERATGFICLRRFQGVTLPEESQDGQLRFF